MRKKTVATLLIIGIICVVCVPSLMTFAGRYRPIAALEAHSIDTIPEDYIELSEEDLLKYPFFKEAIEKSHIVAIHPWTKGASFKHNWGSGSEPLQNWR